MLGIKNKRRGPDKLVKMITFFSFFSWLVIFIVFIIYTVANPPEGSLYSKRARPASSAEILIILAQIILFINVMMSIWGMVINTMRMKRKTDRFHTSLVVSAILSFIGFVLLFAV